jgi:hypothetical protein
VALWLVIAGRHSGYLRTLRDRRMRRIPDVVMESPERAS